MYASREPFHRELARLSFERGRLRLWFLELDGRPAAASLGHRFGGAAWLEQAGRDPAFEHESVGSILRAHVIRDAIEDGVREIKLLRGDQPHKLRFATADPGVVTIGLGRGLVGHAALAGACALPLLPAAPQRVLARLAGQDLGADPRLG